MSIFDILGNGALGNILNNSGLGNILGGASNSGSGGLGNILGDGLGNILDTISGQTRTAQENFNRNITSEGGLGSMLGAGALGALLGNVAGGSLLKNAALLGAGAVALNFYKKWAQGQKEDQRQGFASDTSAPQLDNKTLELIARSMVYAARSDGNIDAEERRVMDSILTNMAPGAHMQSFIKQVEKEQIDPEKIAASVQYPEQADDIYRLSCSVIDVDQYMERAYLDALAKSLRIADSEKNQIEREASDLRKQLTTSA